MPKGRAKGVAYEREVAELWERYGFDVRGLEQGGDHFIVGGHGLLISQECKRRERIALPEWWEQAVSDTVQGGLTCLTFRPNRTRSRSMFWTDEIAQALARRS